MFKRIIFLMLFPVATSLPASVVANELNTQVWGFPTYEQAATRNNRLILLCDAQPTKCPTHLYRARNGLVRNARLAGVGGSGGSGTDSIYDSNSSSSANNSNIVVSGDNNSITLTTSQSSQDDTISSGNEGDATIDAVIENDEQTYVDIVENR